GRLCVRVATWRSGTQPTCSGRRGSVLSRDPGGLRGDRRGQPAWLRLAASRGAGGEPSRDRIERAVRGGARPALRLAARIRGAPTKPASWGGSGGPRGRERPASPCNLKPGVVPGHHVDRLDGDARALAGGAGDRRPSRRVRRAELALIKALPELEHSVRVRREVCPPADLHPPQVEVALSGLGHHRDARVALQIADLL